MKSLSQFLKFITVGFLNTGIDFGVLNILMVITGITAGIFYSLFKSISFLCAVTNSYFFNKYWTFQKGRNFKKNEFLVFLIISVVAFSVNVGVASFLVNVIKPIKGISSFLWANLSAVAAVILTLSINFLGYKYIVFKD